MANVWSRIGAVSRGHAKVPEAVHACAGGVDKFGDTPDKLIGSDANDPVKVANFLKGKNGIYVIVNAQSGNAGYTGHVDAIVNGRCVSGAYTNPKGGVSSIRVWQLN